MGYELVKVEVDQQVAVITLDRPDALNALSAALRAELVAALSACNSDGGVRAVVLTGAGKAFCAGLDLNELQAAGDEVASDGIIGAELLAALAAMDCPVIAAVNGYAITGGLELALCCDMIIASEQAVFADTHARVGIVPAWGVTQRLPRIIGPMRAREMSLSARKISAQQAYEWGLVNRVVAPGQLLEEATALGRDIAAGSASAQRVIKKLIDDGWESVIADGLAEEQRASVRAFKDFAGSDNQV
jgi:enoyl-CoA hydratase/carnithine racemase